MTTANEQTVQRVGAESVDRVATALAGAFFDDPVMSWLVPPGGADRHERLKSLFGAVTRGYVRREKSVYAGPGGVAAALWGPPGSWKMANSDIARETPALVKAFGRNLTKALRALSAVDAKHPTDRDHWYLGYLGCEPAHQGRGIGASLLRVVLDDCDTKGIPAYLESSNQRNLTLYQRHGFEIVEELPLPGGGPPVWRMWREPRVESADQ
ncbi:MAG TPA: GNAT family N-acetyltransferase [Mycobacteriales bacterium]|jgi:GNAT superfamily N-acetyltransferase|nr:GNAT family N-acetyltransferase [Mycobacteriales bacterium]